MRLDGGADDGARNSTIRWWPSKSRVDSTNVSIATVSYNTIDLVALLLWSIHRFVGSKVARLVVVDNGSTDGSRELLRGCHDAGLCDLIANDENRYHGPALNQAVSFLADAADRGSDVGAWLWLLDSDCVIAREDVIDALIGRALTQDAVLLGERRWDSWHNEARLATFSLFFDPWRVWQPPTEPFREDGDPARAFEHSCREQGFTVAEFPFSLDGFVIHRGRGTLAGIADREENSNRYHCWAADHREAHYELVAGAAERYDALRRELLRCIPHLDGDTFINSIADGQAERP
jgi:glycosyltransferase involved in cell wall biosynthesis